MQPQMKACCRRMSSSVAETAKRKLAKQPQLSLRESIAVVQAREARKQKQREAKLNACSSSVPSFADMMSMHRLPPLTRASTEIVQVNIGKRCNLTCRHCHVESGPTRQENMDERTVDRIIELLDGSLLGPNGVHTVDITGGAPELNPHFRRLVLACKARGLHVMDRCNLSVLFQPGQEDTAKFLADNKVHIIASLPSTSELAVERQRGRGAWASSLQGLRLLNDLGYGKEGGLPLDLVFNPPGNEARLPPPQEELDKMYRDELSSRHGISFTRLLSITNMPVKRYADDLAATGQLEPYMNLLALNFAPAVVPKLMCRGTVSIAWDGSLYDCDFNQQLMLPMTTTTCGVSNGGVAGAGAGGEGSEPARTLWTIKAFTGEGWEGRAVNTSKACYGCTAGAGSSCGGALA